MTAALRRRPVLSGIAAAFLCLTLANAVAPKTPAGFPPLGKPVIEEFAAQDVAFALTGSRRLGADLAFIQLLQYYGDPNFAKLRSLEKRAAAAPPAHSDDDGHHHIGAENDAPSDKPLPDFPFLREFALRVGAVDPYFTYSFLFAGGALGFNLRRAEDALDVLADGSAKNPTFWRFRQYAAAIGYRQKNAEEKAIPLLEDALKDPEAPSMLKNILAGIYRKRGNNRRAAELYLELLEGSRDREYVTQAKRNLQEMGLLPRD